MKLFKLSAFILFISFLFTSSCDEVDTYDEYMIRNEKRYITLLQKYSTYNNTSTVNTDFSFTYMNANNLNLSNLKTQYNLDSQIAAGDETQTIINLMFWVNNVVKHYGDLNNPQIVNANILIERGKANCRGVSIVLNDVYLAMGFNSRILVCLPWNRNDSECHVINIVYSTTLNKWIYMDASFRAYFTDANGNLQSVREVRQKMISGETLKINNDITHNGDTKSKNSYYAYMAKNLFFFSCPIASEYNYESQEWTDREYIYLNPDKYDFIPGNSNERVIVNADKFWEAP